MNRINFYILNELIKGFLLVFFIFISIAWLLQFTRLISISNLLQIDILAILKLSIYLIPNLFSTILPFVIIIGITITFLKLYKDRELITIYSHGLNTNPLKKSLVIFTSIILFLSFFLNFYISPNIYEKYKINEFELRNTINIEKIIFSNFLEIDKNIIIDFSKDKKNFNNIYISYTDNLENIIYSKQGFIEQNKGKYIFNLDEGFKLTLLENDNIEKLEFESYVFEFDDKDFKENNNFDKNTSNFFEDIKSKDYLNLSYKFFDTFIIILIIYSFYSYNLKNYKLNQANILLFILFTSSILVLNQILKNLNYSINFYLSISLIYTVLIILTFNYLISKREKN